MAQPPNLTDLSDEILFEIFKNLPIYDLMSILNTCKRVRRVVDYCISTNHKNIQIDISEYSLLYINCDLHHPISKNRLVTFFTNFGKYLKTLEIRDGDGESDLTWILHLVNRFCSKNLKSLVLENGSVDVGQSDQFSDLFKNLKKFHSKCVKNIEKCLNCCENLVELSVQTAKATNNSLLANTYPELERIVYDFNESTVEPEEVLEFLKNHSKLKLIKLSNLLPPTARYLKHIKNVETLFIDVGAMAIIDSNTIDWIQLFQLDNLKQLELKLTRDTIHSSLGTVIANPSTKIETLALKVFHLNDVLDLLQAFTYENLKKLVVSSYLFTKMWYRSNAELTDSYTKALENIEELHFLDFSENFFNEFVLPLVKNAGILKRLLLEPKQPLTFVSLRKLAGIQTDKQDKLIVHYYNYLMDDNAKKMISIRKIDPSFKFLELKEINDGRHEFFSH